VYGDSFENFLVAIVVLDDDYVKKWAENEGNNVETIVSHESNPKLKQTILNDMIREGKRRGLMSYEQVKAIEFIKEPFTIENGLLTPTFKSRRYAIEKKYKELFQQIYKSVNS
jgi:long-chain acyl-CoA synthetase